MTYVWKSDKRERHALIERAITATEVRLDMPSVVNHLGDTALMLSNVNEMLFVPNIRNGRIVPPKGYWDKDIIPIVAVDYDEQMSSLMSDAMPLQLNVAKCIAYSALSKTNHEHKKSFASVIASNIYRTNNIDNVKVPRFAAAECVCRECLFEKEDGSRFVRMFGRPHIFLSLSIKERNDNYLACAMVHEEYHASDYIRKSICLEPGNDDEYKLGFELGGYGAEDAFSRAIYGPSYAENASSIAHRVEEIRERYNGPLNSLDATDPKKIIMEEIAAAGLDYVYKRKH